MATWRGTGGAQVKETEFLEYPGHLEGVNDVVDGEQKSYGCWNKTGAGFVFITIDMLKKKHHYFSTPRNMQACFIKEKKLIFNGLPHCCQLARQCAAGTLYKEECAANKKRLRTTVLKVRRNFYQFLVNCIYY